MTENQKAEIISIIKDWNVEHPSVVRFRIAQHTHAVVMIVEPDCTLYSPSLFLRRFERRGYFTLIEVVPNGGIEIHIHE